VRPSRFHELLNHTILRPAGRQTARSGFYSLAGFGASFLVVVGCTPAVLHHLGAHSFGVWSLATSLLGFAGFAENGMGTAVVAQVGRYRSVGEPHRIVGVFGAAIVLSVTVGAGLGLLMYALAPLVAGLAAAHHVDPHTMVHILRLVGIAYVPVLLRGTGLGVAMGLQRYDLAAVVTALQGLAIWGGALLAVIIGAGVDGVLETTVAATWITSLVAVVVAARMMSARAWQLRSIRDEFGALVRYSPFSTVSGLGSQIFGSLDKVTVGLVLGPTSLAYYATVAGVAAKVNQLAGLLWQGLVPIASGWKAVGAYERLTRGLQYSTAASIALNGLISAVLLVTSAPILRLWLGPEFAANALAPYRILVLVYALFSVAAPAYHIANGISLPWINTATTLVGGSLTIVLILVLSRPFGVIGAAIANGGYWFVLLTILLVHHQITAFAHAAARSKERASTPSVRPAPLAERYERQER
jgi:O-antigen/teichoic acid export membrane protein